MVFLLFTSLPPPQHSAASAITSVASSDRKGNFTRSLKDFGYTTLNREVGPGTMLRRIKQGLEPLYSHPAIFTGMLLKAVVTSAGAGVAKEKSLKITPMSTILMSALKKILTL